LVKTLKRPAPSQIKMGKNKGGFSTFVRPEIKKPDISKRPKKNIKISSILISIILPSDNFPTAKLEQKAMAAAKRIKDKILTASFKSIFIVYCFSGIISFIRPTKDPKP